MIKNFIHKELKEFFVHNNKRLLNARFCDRISRILDILDVAETKDDLNLPGFGLHKLSGNRKDALSVKISGNWRITFRFESGHVYDVSLEDYH